MSTNFKKKLVKKYLGDDSIDDKNEKKYEISLLETENAIYEQARYDANDESEGKIHKTGFLRYDKKTKEVEMVDEIEYNDKKYVPIDNKIVSKKRVNLPNQATEYGTDQELVEEISKFLFSYFQVPKFYEVLLPYIVLFYWIADQFPFIPYLHFVGLPATGKSTALDVMGSICYKAIKSGGAVTVASIFRIANQWKGTLLVNEFEVGEKGSDLARSLVQLLKSGVEDDPLYRVEGEGKKDIELYELKAPRIFASQEEIDNAALQSRTIMVKMDKNKRRLPLYRLPDFKVKSQDLINKLTLWRFRHFNSINLAEIEYGIPELEGFDRRVQQVLTPIYHLADEEAKKTIVELVKQQEEETRRERLEGQDGQIMEFIFGELSKMTIPTDIMVKDITAHLNSLRSKFQKDLSEKEVATFIRKVLHLKTSKTMYGVRVDISEKEIEQLGEYYGLSIEEMKNAPAPVSVEEEAEGLLESL